MKNRNRMIVNCVTASLMYYWSLPALAEQSSSEIKIVRDEYGMPHIYANDTWVFCCLKFKLFKIMMLETLFFNDGDKMAAASKRERHLS